MAKAFEVESRPSGGTLTLKLVGELDGSSASEIAAYLDQVNGRYERFVIDATRIGNVHPFGQAVLDRAIGRLRRTSSHLRVAGEVRAKR